MSQVPLRVSTLITPKDLAEKMTSAANIRILDGTWHMALTGFSGKKNPLQEFYRDHIPGAQFFDIDACIDKTSPYEHMLPTPEQFAEHVGKLGISNNTHVVVYDNNTNFGLFSAQRVWWTFRVFGHSLVSVLDGGLPRWMKEGYYTTDEVDKVPPQTFHPRFIPALVKRFEDMEANLTSNAFQVIDARPSSRYDGSGSEPTPGVKPGHIPNAISLPFTTFLDRKEKRLKTKGELLDIFDDAEIDLSKPIVAMCGRGLVSGVVALAAHVCGKSNVAIYDGSWVEWYQRAKYEQKIDVPK